ncbi:hypothetical protein F0562_011260 [Nyssa sinensis]|uniref:Zinc finger PHD-type domain-containing protein n=1 Tax=Nyssa sinensis TaxID=561372 RepID=A0A5J5A667_9ASTE|nr:hypothetical protein F0562_011260 [Nyssa sinensis]
MAITTSAAPKKRKRRDKLYDFHTFAEKGCPIDPTGSFRHNIRIFLQECTEIENYTVEGMPTWRTTLRVYKNRELRVPLYTVEETVKHSPKPFCDDCISTGSEFRVLIFELYLKLEASFVSKRRYHLIIPGDDKWNDPLEDGVFDIHSHLLHGLIHCNGFGHLLCINGIEGGSKYLRGREIMDLWDRICTNLQTRKITVEDASKKHSVDVRLLYGVAYGHVWFGRWGYRFCRGSFGVTEYKYDRAIEMLSSLTLDQIIRDFGNTKQRQEIKRIIHRYRDLSETQLITIRDLLRFVLTLKSLAPAKGQPAMDASSASPVVQPLTRTAKHAPSFAKKKQVTYEEFAKTVAKMDSRWTTRTLEHAAKVIVDELKERESSKGGNGGIPRHELREATRQHIGNTGLLDFTMKFLNNVIVGTHFVGRSVNPSTRVYEYKIHELSNCALVNGTDGETGTEQLLAPALQAASDIYIDVVYLYTNVLLGYPELELVELASRTVLDSKHFVKEWPVTNEEDQSLRFICRVMPNLNELAYELKTELLPGELIVVPLQVTVDELKEAAQSAMRDTYCIMERFKVNEVESMEGMEDEEVPFGKIPEFQVRGSGIDWGTELRYEGGANNWTVKCECGALDDDGERMVACDICEVWQHTRCSGIDNVDAVPPFFVCARCNASLVPARTELGSQFECSELYGSLLLPLPAQLGLDLC